MRPHCAMNGIEMLKLATKPFACILCIILAVAFMLFTTPANAQICNKLDPTVCLNSPDCMYQQIEGKQYACVAPTNRCQIGFTQQIYSNMLVTEGGKVVDTSTYLTRETCEDRPGCSYVSAGECYCPPDVDCVCGGGTPPNCAVDADAKLTPPAGRYVIVDIRNASDVAAPLDATPQTEIINQAFTFTADRVLADGLGCDSWVVESVENGISFNDPILADVLIGPVDLSFAPADRRILDHWRYTCEGEHFLTLTRIDQRVLVILWNNSAQYLIAEKPLNVAEVERLQKELKTMKFYDGNITGLIDDATVSSLGFWAQYHVYPKETYRFARTAITENLLDALRVLTPN